MVEAMTTMPKVLSEVARIEDVLKSLESEMSSLASQLKAFDQRNVAGVEDLSRLDTLKSNMEKCKSTLEEHARWSQLVREARAFMEGGGRLSDTADRWENIDLPQYFRLNEINYAVISIKTGYYDSVL
jgi:cell division FtsZ-interacting protein ZapD